MNQSKHQREKFNICLATDANYLLYCRNTIVSILHQTRAYEFYEFIILSAGLSEDDMNLMRKSLANYSNAEIRFIDTSPYSRNLPQKVRAYYSVVTYYRALLFSDLFHEYDRILYLDSDIMVRGNLSELFHMEIKDYAAAVVKDYTMDAKILYDIPIDYLGKQYTAESYISEVIGIRNFDSYFNAGVILFNLKKCRELWRYEDVLSVFGRETFFLQDQDALNILMENHILYLETKWNFQNVYILLEEETLEEGKRLWQRVKCSDPAIIHYVSSIKPWNNKDCPMISFYREFLQ